MSEARVKSYDEGSPSEPPTGSRTASENNPANAPIGTASQEAIALTRVLTAARTAVRLALIHVGRAVQAGAGSQPAKVPPEFRQEPPEWTAEEFARAAAIVGAKLAETDTHLQAFLEGTKEALEVARTNRLI